MPNRFKSSFAGPLAAAALLLTGAPAQAALFGHPKPHPDQPLLTETQVADVHRAIDEQRYVDASQLLDAATMAGVPDPRISLLRGELCLARGQYPAALDLFRQVDGAAVTHAEALEGEGLALSMLSRSEEAMPVLQAAVTANPAAWRAWNALGSEYDKRQDWAQAQTAYDHAFADSDGAAIVLNNRGYSKLLQNHVDEAVLDFVGALKKRPDLVAARTNLRLAMAMRGDYDRAVASGGGEDEAALLNNAGFAAILRGDYARADDLLQRAVKAKSDYYGRALAHDLENHPAAVARVTATPATTAASSPTPAAPATHADH